MIPSWFIKSIVMPLGDMAMRTSMMRRLRFLEQAQWWPAERLQAERDRLLRETVAIAYRDVPFYRHLFDQAGVNPADIRKPEDLRRLPAVTKDMLRPGYPERVTRATGRKLHEKTTSGSTGKNFAVLEDDATSAWYRATLLLTLEWAGWRVGEPHLQTGIRLPRTGLKRIKDVLLACHYFSALSLDDDSLDRNLEVLDRHNIAHVWGYPISLYYLARRAAQKGWNRPMKSIATWGDTLYPEYRRTIESAFQRRVFDTYGCSEGIQISAQCGTGQNYHVHALDTIVEYVDEHNQPVPQDQPGRLLLTRLHAGAMPLIRYQVGDLGVAGDQAPCPCGRGFPRMHSVHGRSSDTVLTPSGNRLTFYSFLPPLEPIKEIDSYQIRQEELARITLLVVPTPRFTPDTLAKIKAALRKAPAPELQVDVEVVDRIPVGPMGKRRFVVSTLKQ